MVVTGTRECREGRVRMERRVRLLAIWWIEHVILEKK